MSMDSGRIERFQLLLQQIQLTGDAIVPYFSNAQIEKLVIEKKTRNWHFHFLLEKILPYNIFINLLINWKQRFHILLTHLILLRY